MAEDYAKRRRNKILSDAIMDAIGAAVGIEIGMARRIVLDTEIGQPVRVYIEFLGDTTRMVDLQLPRFGPGDFELIRPGEPDASDGS